ncbi:MAG: FHA domain-containing protein [Acidobacteria bacterium]|nr:FHA domain-containing protein [Acidobacteriota bacterium]
MHPEVTLTFNDEAGRERRVKVHAGRFSIGRGPENDLVISDQRLSRRHAVIENFGGGVRVTDCGSQNGTRVNDVPAVGAVELRDGDIIALGGSCDLAVSIGAAGYSVDSERPFAPAPSWLPDWLSAPVVAVASIVLIVLAAATLIIIQQSKSEETSAGTSHQDPVINQDDNDNRRDDNRSGDGSPPTNTASTPTPGVDAVRTSDPPASEQVKKDTKNVMRRLGDGSGLYISEDGLRDVAAAVEGLRGSPAVREQLVAMGRDGAEVAAQARRAGLDPALLIYAALAETAGGGASNPKAAAGALLRDMLDSQVTIGTQTANSSLLLVAACKYDFKPGDKKTAHPLIAHARVLGSKAKVEPGVARSVWFLREKGGISDAAYNFVLRFLALAVIARNPSRYGTDADPLPW